MATPTSMPREALSAAFDSGLPYRGLRDFALDRRLLTYVPLAQARRLEVLPLALTDDRLELACTSPATDISTIAGCLPRLDIEVILADRDELLAALDRAEA